MSGKKDQAHWFVDEETDQYLQGGKHRPPRLYRYTGRPGLDPDNRSTP